MMNHPAPLQRRRLGWAAVAWLLNPLLPARALEAPSGKVLLTVSGAIGHPNENGAAAFDLALLQALPQHSFATRTPWYPQPRKFTGVRFADLLSAVGAAATVTVKATALNDYRIEMPADELIRHGALIAHLLDDQPMAVRDKGPLVVIFPFDERPELRTAIHYSRAIWQLRSLELR